MADELLSFPATVAVLQQLAEDVKAGYIDQLKLNGHWTRDGKDRLIDTITTQVTVDGKTFTASLNMNHYWKYLEEGEIQQPRLEIVPLHPSLGGDKARHTQARFKGPHPQPEVPGVPHREGTKPRW